MLDNGLYEQLAEVCFAKIEMRADYRDQGGGSSARYKGENRN